MTYAISKIFWIVFRPLNLVFFLMLGGLLLRKFALRTSLRRLASGMIGISAVTFVVFGFTNLPDYMLYQMENQAVSAELPEKPAGIIVLGGGLNGQITRLRNVDYAMSEGGERLIAGFELSKRFPDIRLIYSGGPPAGNAERDPETAVAQNIATALYGEGKLMVAEDRSRNTWENAVFLKELLKATSGSKWIVITSAFHAVRTTAIFNRIGFDFVLYPTDYRAEYIGGFEFKDDAVKQFKKADLVLKELAGIVAYTLMGRIDWPF